MKQKWSFRMPQSDRNYLMQKMSEQYKNKKAKFVLFGPPGIGKSTLCEILGGIDLETFPADNRISSLRHSGAGIYGAADLNPQSYPYDDVTWVCLKLPEKVYVKRRDRRNEEKPNKADQPVLHVSDFTVKERHIDVDVSGSSVKAAYAILFAILDFIKKGE